jgi:predicted DNA-binding protein (MmcQ/YjbR family)
MLPPGRGRVEGVEHVPQGDVLVGDGHVRKSKGMKDPIKRLRQICLRFPEAVERPFGGHSAPAFRVGGKLFLMTSEDGRSMTFKARPGLQQILVGSDAERFFVPAYVGHKGWVGARLDVDHDWDEIAELVEESYRMTAPKRLAALLENS